MIDEATLDLWDRCVCPDPCGQRLRESIQEIRRLREEISAWQTSQEIANVMMKKTEADLAAHRAVVRELAASVADKSGITPEEEQLLAHPLVVAAREEQV